MLKVYLPLTFVLKALVLSVGFRASRSHYGWPSILMSSKDSTIVKLPIVQVVKENVISCEFVMGSNLEKSVSMLEATMQAEVSKYANTKEPRGHSVDNIYSDEHLLDVFNRNGLLVVFELYKDGCKKCATFDPIFHDMAKKMEFPEGAVKWIKADIENVPGYAEIVKKRLLGGNPSS